MTTDTTQRSARIYQFPVRPRAAAGGQREPIETAAREEAPMIMDAAFGGAWYHDEAIQTARSASHRRPTR